MQQRGYYEDELPGIGEQIHLTIAPPYIDGCQNKEPVRLSKRHNGLLYAALVHNNLTHGMPMRDIDIARSLNKDNPPDVSYSQKQVCELRCLLQEACADTFEIERITDDIDPGYEFHQRRPIRIYSHCMTRGGDRAQPVYRSTVVFPPKEHWLRRLIQGLTPR